MQWTRILRRSVAFFLVTVTVWFLTLTADMGAAAESIRALGGSAEFVEAALTAELGTVEETEGPLAGVTRWGRLVLAQSPLLRAGEASVAEHLAREAEPQVPRDPPPTPQPAPQLTGTGTGPQILILHSHSTEAYTPDGGSAYRESDSYRTTDTQYNMVRVGDVLAEALGAEGFTVLHDRTLYDYPHYSGAYGRSYAAVEAYLKEYPSLSVVLDVHRDAIYTTEGEIDKTQAEGIPESARVLLVVGSNQDGLHPNFQQNLNLANALQGGVAAEYPSLVSGVDLRASHFNQQLSPGALLLEVGSHGNTLGEAETAARLFAEAAAATLRGLLFPEQTAGG